MPKFVEIRRLPAPKPIGLEQVITALHELGAKVAQMPAPVVNVPPNDSSERIVEAIQGLEFVLPDPVVQPKKWTFDIENVERDQDGRMKSVTVTAREQE